MVNTYGEKEMINLTDRNNPKTGTVNTVVMEANIDDAEAEIITKLGCCFSISAILEIYAASGFVPTLNHWAKVVTRLHLYSSLERDESQVSKAYEDYKEEIEELCKCGILVDNTGVEIPRKTIFSFVEDTTTTCCCIGDCCCGMARFCL
ncbi:MAG TPA: DUF1320 family protein [Flavobacterium alvei]|nr:DUF1320 family protein [Flavobacterium alvei]